VAQLQEGEAEAPWAQLSHREHQEGPQQWHAYINVEKAFGVTGHLDGESYRLGPCLVQPWAVRHLDHAQAQVAWAEGFDHQVQDHS
jgi:hypothetical protein